MHKNHTGTPELLSLIQENRKELMGTAALLILVFHCWLIILPGHAILGLLENRVKYTGFIGVDIFFLLSGMGLVRAMQGRTISQFYARRFSRLIFPYLFCAVLHGLWSRWTPVQWLLRLSGTFLILDSMYAFLWFVPAILILYLLFPFYLSLLRRIGHETIGLMLSLLCWFAASRLLVHVLRPDLWGFTNRLPIFAVGVWLGRINESRRIPLHPVHLFAGTAALLLGGFLMEQTRPGRLHLLVPDSSSALPAFLLACSLTLLLSFLFHHMKQTKAAPLLIPLSFIGGITLELYCVQELLFGILYTILEGHVSYLCINLISLIAALTAAWLLSRLKSCVESCFYRT